MSRWSVASVLLALCALDLSIHRESSLCAYAEGEDAVTVEDDAGSEASKADAAPGEAADGEANSEEGAQKFVDSANELQEKLGQLKALLAAKGETADPALKESLASLEKQLGSLGLGLDGLTEDPASKKDLSEFLANCVLMSMRKLGARRPSTLGALRQLSSGKLKQTDAANVELIRLTAVCINELTDEELQDAKAGTKLTPLPKHLVDKAGKPEAREYVVALDAKIWQELQLVAKTLIAQLAGDDAEPMPYMYGLIAGVPVLLAVGFLTKKFLDMQKEKDEKKEKKKNKSK